GQGEAEHGVGGVAIIQAGREADGAGGQIMAADNGDIAAGAVAAAIGAAPRRPPRLIDWRERRARLPEHRGISERDLGRHGLALARKAGRRWPRFAVAGTRPLVGTANPPTADGEGTQE